MATMLEPSVKWRQKEASILRGEQNAIPMLVIIGIIELQIDIRTTKYPEMIKVNCVIN
jgi:hypothetical protein